MRSWSWAIVVAGVLVACTGDKGDDTGATTCDTAAAEAEICDDELDNDCDGAIDADDSDCETTTPGCRSASADCG